MNKLYLLAGVFITTLITSIPNTHAAVIKIRNSETYFSILTVAFIGLIISGILNAILERQIKPDSNVLLKWLHSLSKLVFGLCFPTCALFIGIMIIGFVIMIIEFAIRLFG